MVSIFYTATHFQTSAIFMRDNGTWAA